MISHMPNTSLAINLPAADRTQLEQWESAHGTPQQVALRCRIILDAVAGEQNVAIAEKLRVSRPPRGGGGARGGAREGGGGACAAPRGGGQKAAVRSGHARADHPSDLA